MSSTAAELVGATPAQIAEARIAVSTFLASLFPSLSLQVGPLADLVVGPSTDALAAVDVYAAEVTASVNPYTALAQGVYDATILNASLAGLGVTRGTAAQAVGSVALRFTPSSLNVSVQAGFQLSTADGIFFQTSAPVRLLPPGSVATFASDQVMVTDPNGNYVGVVPVIAVVAGLSGNRPAGTSLTASAPQATLNLAYLATDATGGLDAETDAALLARLPAATAPRSDASFLGAAGVVQNAYPDFSSVQVVGYGDPAMLRGRSVLTGQTPGRADVRVRVASPPGRTGLPVTATYQGLSGPYGLWQFTIGADVVPGWFEVERIVQPNAVLTSGGYPPTLLVPGYDTSGSPNPPDIRTPQDAFFSIFSTVTVQFVDPNTPTSGLVPHVSTKLYTAVLRAIPGLDDAQAALEESNVRAVGGDSLARAAAPVLVSVSVIATLPPGATTTAAQVAEAVTQSIDNVPIGLVLASSVVGTGAAALLPTGTSLSLSGWSGVVYLWDGTTITVSGSDGLTIATNTAEGLAVNTVAYYCDVEDVTATIN